MVNDASVEKTDSDPESMGLDQQVSDSTPFCRPLQNEELKNSMMMDFFFSKKKRFSVIFYLCSFAALLICAQEPSCLN